MAEKSVVPKHIAIIMDGNGRWAKEKGLPRTSGHREGTKRVKEIVTACGEFGVNVLTLFAFSTENWNRPKQEISMLMRYLEIFLMRELEAMHKKNIRFFLIGRGDPLPARLQEKLKKAELKTQHNTGLKLVLAINYGSRQEILDAAEKYAGAVLEGTEKPGKLDSEIFEKYLYTSGLPDPDLLIRTAGQMRISNFLLWQLSYAELYFPAKYWPDFKRDDLLEAIKEFERRERRFGGI